MGRAMTQDRTKDRTNPSPPRAIAIGIACGVCTAVFWAAGFVAARHGIVIGGEAITTIGVHGVAGDLLFVLAGAFFATFGMLLREWRVAPTRAMIATSVVSLAILPIYGVLVGFSRFAALGLWENLLQAV